MVGAASRDGRRLNRASGIDVPKSLAELAADGSMDPGWAAALEPVADRIAAMGEFLRAEVAAGRPYLPAGENVLRAFRAPLADVRVLIVGQDPYPTPGHPIGLSFATCDPCRAACRTSTANSATTSASLHLLTAT